MPPPLQKKKHTTDHPQMQQPCLHRYEKTSSCSPLASSVRRSVVPFCGRKRASSMVEKQRFSKHGRSCTALNSVPEERV